MVVSGERAEYGLGHRLVRYISLRSVGFAVTIGDAACRTEVG